MASTAYAIRPIQQQHLLRAAYIWLRSRPQYCGYQLQFDAFLIDKQDQTRRIENACSLL